MRGGTSISVGYMAENYADLGFPGMLVGVLVLGAITVRWPGISATCPMAWMVREAIVHGVHLHVREYRT